METTQHALGRLFRQLGYADDPDTIEAFISSHRLAAGVALADAPFWSAAQARFLREALEQDSDWAEVADQLAVRLT